MANKHTKRWRQVIFSRDNWTCRYCGEKKAEAELSVDHFWPLFLGGKESPENYCCSCQSCNQVKSHLPPLFFRAHVQELKRAYREEAELFAKLIHDRAEAQ